LTLIAVIAVITGCENAHQGAVSGAGIGALSGLAIGSMSGNAGRGAATGAIVGGVGGAAIGDQNRRRNEEAARQPAPSSQAIVAQPRSAPVTTPVPPAPVIVQQSFQASAALGRLVGQWNVSGTIDAGNGTTLPVHGTARASVDMSYFVRLDVHFTDPRNGEVVDGTSVISQTGQRGLEMTSSFSSSPDVRRYRGEMDASGNVLNFNQVSPASSSRRIVMRLSPGNEWTAEVWDRGNRIESYTFTWIGS
jgi:surface antigen